MLKKTHRRRVLLYAAIILLCLLILWHRSNYAMPPIPALQTMQQQMRLLIG